MPRKLDNFVGIASIYFDSRRRRSEKVKPHNLVQFETVLPWRLPILQTDHESARNQAFSNERMILDEVTWKKFSK
ncbi:hypothetical protein HN588_12335 [Candidatus Bathyarchaeota archaeon]|nr:hypothetical protein [Candidatus Bathyarchaeota archaeon]